MPILRFRDSEVAEQPGDGTGILPETQQHIRDSKADTEQSHHNGTDEQPTATQKAIDEFLLVCKVSCQLGVHDFQYRSVLVGEFSMPSIRLQCRYCNAPSVIYCNGKKYASVSLLPGEECQIMISRLNAERIKQGLEPCV